MPIFSIASAGCSTVVPPTKLSIVTDGLQVYYDASNVQCYNSALSTTTLYDLSGKDADAEARKGTLLAFNGTAPPIVTDGVVVLSATADSQFVETNYSSVMTAPSTTYTYEIWFWDDAYGVTNGGNTALVGNIVGTSQAQFAIMHISTTGGVLIAEKLSTESPAANQATSDPIPLNRWNHLVKTADTTNQKLYINGVEALNINRPFGAISLDPNNKFRFGGGFGTRAQTCKLGPMRIYMGKALSADEVVNNFNAEKARFGV